MQDTQKTSYWQDTNVYISENKLAEDLKIGHYTGNIFFFLLLRCYFTETECNLAKSDESVNKTCKTHKKHRIDKIQTFISLKINQLEIWKLITTLEMYSSFFNWDIILLETECNLAKIDESVNKTCKTHKKHRYDKIQTFISLKIN